MVLLKTTRKRRKQNPRISISDSQSKYLGKLAKKTGANKAEIFAKIVKFVKQKQGEFETFATDV